MPGVSLRGRIFLGILVLVCWALSFAYWKGADIQEMILSVHPEWEVSGYVLYDGYGVYAEHIQNLITGPTAEEKAAWEEFSQHYIHIYRPLFPALVALVNLVLGNLVLSAMLVNTLSLVALAFIWNRILTRQMRLEGTPLLLAHTVALAHVAVIGVLARPMPDPMALSIILGFLTILVDASRHFRPWHAAALIGLLVIGVATKMVAILLIPVAALALLNGQDESPARRAFKAVLLLGGSFVLVAGTAGTLLLLAPESAGADFLRRAVAGVVETIRRWPPPGYLKAALLFLALGLQIWVVFWFRKGLLRDAVARVHLLWIGFYVLQRLLFYGFSLDHSRARYAFPLALSCLIIAWPGVQERLKPRGVVWLAGFMAGANLLVWAALLLRET